MLRCVVIDDESLAREVLTGYLERLNHAVTRFGTAREALAYLAYNEADVLFLDIEMPGMNGLEFLRTLEQPPLTVFTTAYRDYAFDGYELGVIDFLLKPISLSRFTQSVQKVQDFLALRDPNTHLENEPAGFVFVKSGIQRIRLNLDDVSHIQGLKDYAIIHTSTGKIVIKGSIKSIHTIFPEERFIRVHKSFVVAAAGISRIERNQLLVAGHAVPIGRSYREKIDELLAGRNR